MKALVPVLIICALAVASGFTVSDVREEVKPKGRYAGLEAHETHASASLLGQFRTSVSGWLWLRTDLYLHNGVAMRPLTDQEIAAGRTGVGSSDNHEGHLHDDSKIVTVIPGAKDDFRGIFGDIERATRAYKDMTGHDHNNPRQALPLFRLMTWIDPQFINGWAVGAAVLAMGKDKLGHEQAAEFLQQGLEHNPESITLLNQLGFTYTARLQKWNLATPTFEKARSIGNKYPLDRLTTDDQDSLRQAYRWLALLYRETGVLDKKYAVLREGLIKFPEDTPMNRMLNAPPLVLAPTTKRETVVLEEPEQPFAH